MGKTSIQWTDRSINPFRARMKDGSNHVPGHHCEKVSAGCANCYASTMQKRFQMPPYLATRRGGESGPHARHCDQRWITRVIQQCGYAGVPCFVKQLGSTLAKEMNLADRKGGDIDEWLGTFKVREFPA